MNYLLSYLESIAEYHTIVRIRTKKELPGYFWNKDLQCYEEGDSLLRKRVLKFIDNKRRKECPLCEAGHKATKNKNKYKEVII